MAENKKEACWYVVHTYSGYENKVKDTLEKSVENNGMQDLILRFGFPWKKLSRSGTESVSRVPEKSTRAMCWFT